MHAEPSYSRDDTEEPDQSISTAALPEDDDDDDDEEVEEDEDDEDDDDDDEEDDDEEGEVSQDVTEDPISPGRPSTGTATDGAEGRDGGGGAGGGTRRGGGRSSHSSSYHHLRIRASPTLSLLSDPAASHSVREIGKSASWSLSTAKPGNGVDQLRDSSLDTYWQSDGVQPHLINVQFPRRQTIAAISLYLDFNLDESYTPKRFKILVGTNFHDLEEVRVIEVREPVGWVTVSLWRRHGEDPLDAVLDPERERDEDDDDDNNDDGGDERRRKRKKRHVPAWKRKPMRTHFVQIGVTSMHQNGRDTHVRQVKIFGPRDGGGLGGGGGASSRGVVRSAEAKIGVQAFQSVNFASTIR